MLKIRNILFLVVLNLSFLGFSTEETYSVRKAVSYNTVDISVEDGRFYELNNSPNFIDASTHLRVKLGIEERSYFGLINNFGNIEVQLKVTPIDNSGNLSTELVETLKINYTSNSVTNTYDINTSVFKHSNDFHKYKIEVVVITPGLTSIPDNIYIESELVIDRYYEISQTIAPSIGANYVTYNALGQRSKTETATISSSNDNNGQELEIFWNFVEGAEEYELEWTWIDNYEANDLNAEILSSSIDLSERNFELNNTRIITNKQSYIIPLIYDKGYLVYRVRGVGRWLDNSFLDVKKVKFGAWTKSGSSLTKVSSWAPNYITIKASHESLKNWQFQSVYAEGGKKKEIISYFDGSLRNRQTVTKINSNDEAIVGENIYDNQGRSAIQILPTPVNNPALKYYPQLNKVVGSGGSPSSFGFPISHNDFDWDDASFSSCNAESAKLSTVSGASKYYSQNNLIENNWQDQVPNSNLYPYVQVEYTPDNTGRISTQSGVGSAYKIDGDRTTQYFYAQASQKELNRLFGYQVGNSAHYKKNTVVDANGQVSISYLDPQGRVIATSLAGDNSTSLNSLDDELNTDLHKFIRKDVLSKLDSLAEDTPTDDNQLFISGLNGAKEDGLEANTVVVPSKDDNNHNFIYSIQTTYFEPCTTEVYPFAYTLNIDLRNSCGDALISHDSVNVNGRLQAQFNTIDYAGTYEWSSELDIDNHQLSKRLVVDPNKLEEYAEFYIDSSACIDPLVYEDNADCGDPVVILPLSFSDNGLSCSVVELMMHQDVSPNGQYGAIDGNDPLSVFTQTGYSGGLLIINRLAKGFESAWDEKNYKYLGIGNDYVDSYGALSYIEVVYDESTESFTPSVDSRIDATAPLNISNSPSSAIQIVDEANNLYRVKAKYVDLDGFIANWESSWTAELVKLHPEYDYLDYYKQFCGTVSASGSPVDGVSSNAYDVLLNEIVTYEDASTTTNNPLGVDLTPISNGNNTVLFLNDPLNYMTISGLSGLSLVSPLPADADNFIKHFMLDVLSNYKRTNLPLWDFCIRTVVCGSNFSGQCTGAGNFYGMTDVEKDQVWSLYKSTYLGEKKKVMQVFSDYYGIVTGCYNGYINEEVERTPSIAGFLHYPEYYGTNFTVPSGGNYVIGDGKLGYIYADALSNKPPTPSILGLPYSTDWSSAGPSYQLFQEKERRFIPIDNDYNGNLPEDIAIEEIAAVVDHDTYLETGRCAISFALEYFLDALAQQDILSTTTSNGTTNTGSEEVPKFTTSLYEALGGTVLSSGGLLVDITTTLMTSTTLQIKVNDAAGSPNMGSIELTLPVTVSGWNFSNIVGLNTLFYTGNGIGGNTFEILAEVNIGGVIVEKIITGVTTINLNFCDQSVELPCERGNKLGGSIFNAFKNVLANQTLNSVANLNWYGGSELEVQLGDNNQNAVISTNLLASNASFTLTDPDNNLSVIVDFGGTLNVNVINALMGYTINENSSNLQVTFYYFNANTGTVDDVTAIIRYYENTNTRYMDLNCGCDNELGVLDKLEDMINAAIVMYNADHTEDFSSPFPEYTILAEALNLTSDHLLGFNIIQSPFSISFELVEGCLVRLRGYPNSIDQTNILQPITNLNANISGSGEIGWMSCTINFLGGPRYDINTGEDGFCLNIPGCIECVPEPVAPISCTDKYIEFNNYTLPLFIDTLYTEENFCSSNFGYATDDYITYLTTFGIVDTTTADESEYYISIAQFMGTQMGSGVGLPSAMMADAISEYYSYVSNTNDKIIMSWNQYISSVYLLDKTICPQLLQAPNLISINYPCEQFTANVDTVNAHNAYAIYLENKKEEFKTNYIAQAMSTVIENFTYSSFDKEFHYTLYYYDQAGNLIQTVPPAGVKRILADHTTINSERQIDRDPGHVDTTFNTEVDVLPPHELVTQYKYNSLNQLVWQMTPDGGESNFGYDLLGRLVVSQNAKQFEDKQMSYTKYDPIGRIIEVGEMTIDPSLYSLSNGVVEISTGILNQSDANFPVLMAVGSREEVTVTMYDDLTIAGIAGQFEDYSVDNTRNRIVGVMYFDSYSGVESYDNGTFYDYDVHGNVKELIQDINDDDLLTLNIGSKLSKKTKYDYDLVSGNVKEVAYQDGEADQFVHQYCYDADNRITNVLTSNDRVNWEQDAKYFYYDHGPLARTEIGDKKVQALDYAYTIQGWLKGVNSENLTSTNDQGHDGKLANINRMNGTDVMGYSLQYFGGDYDNRLGTNNFLAYSKSNAAQVQLGSSLFNGNIREMYTASTNPNEEYMGTNHTVYGYDQLNRINTMKQEFLMTGMSVSHTPTGQYKSNYSYDPNGNLTTLNRWSANSAHSLSLHIDEFTYSYISGTNQLDHVHDSKGIVVDSDLGNQSVGNYGYDEIGQLVRDDQEEIEKIEWKVTGKVERINRTLGSAKSDLEFTYDAMGNRIVKAEYDNAQTLLNKTYYIRDAQGNVMSVYELKLDDVNGTIADKNNLYLSERNLYGSSRIGMENINEIIASNESSNININSENLGNVNVYNQLIGDKNFELSNHLGNVLQVITDRKYTVSDDGVTVKKYSPDVVSQKDYYPFGMELPNQCSDYDVDVEEEVLTEVFTDDFQTGTSSWTALSNTTINNTNSELEVTHTNVVGIPCSGCPPSTPLLVNRNLVTTAGGEYTLTFDADYVNQFNGSTINLLNLVLVQSTGNTNFTVAPGSTTVTFTATTSDALSFVVLGGPPTTGVPNFTIDNVVLTEITYQTVTATLSCNENDNYRYGFQGQENDPEVKGKGNSVNYKYRMHDPRVGRFFAVDPMAIEYPHNSPYAFCENDVISSVELEGLEKYYAADGSFIGAIGSSTKVMSVNVKDIDIAKKYITAATTNYEKSFAITRKIHNQEEVSDVEKSQEMSFLLAGDKAYKSISSISTDVGMNEDELFIRTFLTVTRIAENGNKPSQEPLGYDVNFGGGTFSDLSKHPNNTVTKWGHTSSAAGAYQFLAGRWSTIAKQEGLTDFSAVSQDKGALYLIREQEKWNPRASGVMDDINNGSLLNAVIKLNGTWTSLPGGSQEQMPKGEFQKIKQQVIAKELKGESAVASDKGTLKL